MMPFAIDHWTAPEDVVGVIDPQQMEETSHGLVVGGQVDLESPRGPDAWRAIKCRRIRILDRLPDPGLALTGQGQGPHPDAVDLFEITLTATPVVFESRVLTTKAINEEDQRRPTHRLHDRRRVEGLQPLDDRRGSTRRHTCRSRSVSFKC